MDYLFENFLQMLQNQIIDRTQCRFIVCYKYGQNVPGRAFSGTFANPGDLIIFELTNQTDFHNLDKRQVLLNVGTEFEFFDDENLSVLLEVVTELVPAKTYHMLLWGHGGGYDLTAEWDGADEASPSPGPRRAMLYDEWIQGANGDNRSLTVYEFKRALENSPIPHFGSICFHNCLMGNIEILNEICDKADYILASAHVLNSNGTIAAEYCTQLMEKGSVDAMKDELFAQIQEDIQHRYHGVNGDFQLLKPDAIPEVVSVVTRLRERVMTLYPTMQPAIDQATAHTYQFDKKDVFYDLADYARQLAQETNDSALQAISHDLQEAMDKVIVKQASVHNAATGDLDRFSLSVVLVDKNTYTEPRDWHYTFRQTYEYSAFHQSTGWGLWLGTNEQTLPTSSTPFGYPATQGN